MAEKVLPFHFETTNMLSKRCELNKINLMISKNKWRVFSLKELINYLSEDSLYGPLLLNSFWSERGRV